MSTLAYVSPWILHGVILARNGVFRMDTIRRIRRRVFRILSGVDKSSVEYRARIWGLLSEDEGYEDNKILPVDHTNQGMNPISSASPYSVPSKANNNIMAYFSVTSHNSNRLFQARLPGKPYMSFFFFFFSFSSREPMFVLLSLGSGDHLTLVGYLCRVMYPCME